jgi:hypothetical protein
MIQKIIFSIAIACISIKSIAQTVTKQTSRYSFNAGYISYKLANAGAQIGVEKNIATVKNFTINSGLQLNYLNESGVQSGIGLHARFGQRYTMPFGLFVESNLGLGVQNTSYTTQVFDYSSGTAIASSSKENKLSLSPSVVLGLGYDFVKYTKLPLKFYVRPAIYWLYPERNTILGTAANIETGLIFKFRK